MTDARQPLPTRGVAGWAVAACVVTTTALLAIHLLDVRGRPQLLPVVPDSTTRVDAFGDPLPVGAVARLGSRRYRVGEGVGLALLPDGERFVAGLADARIGVFDVATGRRLRTIDPLRRWVHDPTDAWTLRRLDPWFAPPAAWVRDGFSRLSVDREGRALLDRARSALPYRVTRKSGSILRHTWTRELARDSGHRAVALLWSSLEQLPAFPIDPQADVLGLPSADGRLVLHQWSDRRGDVLSVYDVRSGRYLWGGQTGRPSVSSAPDDALWLTWASGTEIRDGASGALRAAFPERLVELNDTFAFPPTMDALIAGHHVVPLPEELTERWRDAAVRGADLRELEVHAGSRVVATAADVADGVLRVLVRTVDGLVRIFEYGTGGATRSADGHVRPVVRLAWTPDGSSVLSLDVGGDVVCWNPDDGERRWSSSPRSPVEAIAAPDAAVRSRIGFTLDGRDAVVGLIGSGRSTRATHRLDRIDLATGTSSGIADLESESPEDRTWWIVPLRGDHVAEGQGSTFQVPEGATMRLHPVRGGPPGGAFPIPQFLLAIDAVSADGRTLRAILDRNDAVTGQTAATERWMNLDGRRVAWDALVPRTWRTEFPDLSDAQSSAWEATRPWPVTHVRRGDGWTQFSDDPEFPPTSRGRLIVPYHALTYGLRLETAPDRALGVLFDAEHRAVLLDLLTGRLVFAFPEIPSPVLSVAWSPTGARLATGTIDGTILVWDVEELLGE